jgi:short-subunit dehydrogenase
MEGFYTLITGGSSGIGKALAREWAGRGMNLVLVSRPGPKLESTSAEFKSVYKTDIRSFAADLSRHDAPGWFMN